MSSPPGTAVTRPRSSWLVVRRQRRPVRLPVAAPTLAQALQRAHAPHAELRIRVHGHGRVWCRARRHGREAVPYFAGALRDTGHGVELAGTIHESRQPGFITSTYTAMTLLFGVLAVLCGIARPIVVPGLAVCAPAAIAFGALAVLLRRQRPATFARNADALTYLVRQQFGAGT